MTAREILDVPKARNFITGAAETLANRLGAPDSAASLNAAIGTLLFILQAGIVIGCALEQPGGENQAKRVPWRLGRAFGSTVRRGLAHGATGAHAMGERLQNVRFSLFSAPLRKSVR